MRVLVVLWLFLSGCSFSEDPPLPAEAAVTLVVFTGLGGDAVAVNPMAIVFIREPRQYGRLVSPDANCVIGVGGGNFIAVLETCTQVERRLEGK